MRNHIILRSTSILAFVAIASSPAFAQDSATAQGETASQGLAEIVVTAEKRLGSEQKTPIAMSVISADDLARNGVTDVNALANVAPTLNIAQNNSNTLITIRGVSSRDYTETGDPAVALSVDNFYLQRSVGLNAALFDIERVEVLRGPQGTLYGRNATAGAVNISTVKPTDEYSVSGAAEIGNYGTINAEAAINVPITPTLAVRVAGTKRTHEGYRNNAPLTDGDDQDDTGARIHVQWKPGAFTALVTGEYVKQAGVGAVLKGIPYSDIKPDGTLTFGDRGRWALNNQGYTDIESKGARWAFAYDFGAVSVSYMGGYREMDFNRDNDQDGGTAQNFGFQQNEVVKTQNHEVRLTSNNTGPLKFQAGGYYFKETDDLLTFFQVNGLGATPFNFFTFDYDTKSESKAVFAQVGYEILTDLTIEGGVRYTEDTKTQIGTSDTTGGANAPVRVNNLYEGNKVTWHIGANYQASLSNLLYAKVDRGYKAGGYTSLAEFGPEVITAYEIGSKNRFLGNTLEINLSAFYYDYTDLQVQQNDPVTAISQIFNAGAATLYGGELETVFKPGLYTQIDFNAAYLHAEFDDLCTVVSATCPAAADFSGNRLQQAPRWTLGAGFTQDFVMGASTLTLRAQTRYQSKSFFSFANRATEQQTSYTKTDVTLTYANESWPVTITLFGRNLENSRILTTSEEAAYAGGYLVQYAAPRTYGARLAFAF